jgi:NAD(P)-dependent dehydrogenase (short-subunit alcohol dehydrogenase family)
MVKNIVVFGGSSGVGLATVNRLAAEGHHIYVISRTTGDLATHLIADHIIADVTQDDLVLDGLPDQIDGLVYAPGSIELKPFRSLKLEQFRSDMEINLFGAVKAIQACLKGMKKSDHLPSVVLYSTVAVAQGMPFHASIASAKGAVEGLVKSLAAELAPKIRVNAIAPSLTDTPLAGKLLSSPERREASDQRHPLRRVGKTEDIAAATTFLLSDDSSWISGQILGVDGGLSSLRV